MEIATRRQVQQGRGIAIDTLASRQPPAASRQPPASQPAVLATPGVQRQTICGHGSGSELSGVARHVRMSMTTRSSMEKVWCIDAKANSQR